MMGKLMPWAVMAVLVSYLALPVVAAQGTESGEAPPRTHRGPGNRRPDTERRWKRLDQDSDGRISRSQWQRNNQAFDRIDGDKDGFITKDELKSAAREFRRRHRSRLGEMDADADGNIRDPNGRAKRRSSTAWMPTTMGC